MLHCGLLVVTAPLNNVLFKLGGFLHQASKYVNKVIYIKLEPKFKNEIESLNKNLKNDLINIIPNIYRIASIKSPEIDVRVFINDFPKNISIRPEILLIDNNDTSLKTSFCKKFDLINETVFLKNESDVSENEKIKKIIYESDEKKIYDVTCLGGTFDILHNGHKVFLNEAIVRTNKEIVIGITENSMLKKKTLNELIDSVGDRKKKLHDYLNDVNDQIKYNIIPMNDGFGPSIEFEEIECLFVSQETYNGGLKVNEKRLERNMKETHIFVTKLVEDKDKKSSNEEDKISSSNLRIRKLGTIINEPKNKPLLPKHPYLIGLTGGICSGKSSICKKLSELGAGVINCDLLAQDTYKDKNSIAYQKIIDEFGESILNDNQDICRKKLGDIVFEDNNRLKKLNEIVWPATEILVKNKLEELKLTYKIIVLEVALLLEANWDDKVHQVWVSLIPEEETIKRLKERNGLDREEAIKRMNSQMKNEDRVNRANIIFSTLWDNKTTQLQVEKAWSIINKDYVK